MGELRQQGRHQLSRLRLSVLAEDGQGRRRRLFLTQWQSAEVGGRSGAALSACSTIAVTSGLVGSCEWLTLTAGQTDWTGTSIAAEQPG